MERAMTHVLATINMKGGVGKTTTSVALAETLAGRFKKRVLVIDLDAQTNATAMLIGEARWRQLNDHGLTLAQLFRESLEPGSGRFDLAAAIQHEVSDVIEARPTLRLLPASLDLMDVQDRLAAIPGGRFHTGARPVEILERALRGRLQEYDFVLVDCPPNLGLVTLNGLRLARHYLIPTIPDVLSTTGIPPLLSRIADFSRAVGTPIEPLGIVICKYRTQSAVHHNVLRRLLSESRHGKGPHVFLETPIPDVNRMAAAAEYDPAGRSLNQKYGSSAQLYGGLAAAILKRLESADDAAREAS